MAAINRVGRLITEERNKVARIFLSFFSFFLFLEHLVRRADGAWWWCIGGIPAQKFYDVDPFELRRGIKNTRESFLFWILDLLLGSVAYY